MAENMMKEKKLLGKMVSVQLDFLIQYNEFKIFITLKKHYSLKLIVILIAQIKYKVYIYLNF